MLSVLCLVFFPDWKHIHLLVTPPHRKELKCTFKSLYLTTLGGVTPSSAHNTDIIGNSACSFLSILSLDTGRVSWLPKSTYITWTFDVSPREELSTILARYQPSSSVNWAQQNISFSTRGKVSLSLNWSWNKKNTDANRDIVKTSKQSGIAIWKDRRPLMRYRRLQLSVNTRQKTLFL